MANQSVPYAVVLVKGSKQSIVCNDAGQFQLNVKSLPVTLVAFQYGYSTSEVTVNENQEIMIRLKSKSVNLQEITVSANRTQTLQAKNATVFLAFEFYDNLVVALVNKGHKYNLIQITDENGVIVKEKKAPDGVEQMYTDCFGNIQLLSKEKSHQFYYDYENIIFMDPYPIAEFNLKVKPCQCVLGNYYYFKEVYHKKLKHRYFYVSKNNKDDRRVITVVSNKIASDIFDRDYGLNYFLAERRKGGGYNASVNELSSQLEELQENVPVDDDYAFKMVPAESEMIKRDSCLLVVDYTNKLINSYNFLGKLMKQDSLLLNNLYPKSLIDLDKGKVYFVTNNKGFFTLYDYNMSSNDLSKIPVEGFSFIKNLRCRNGYLYFLYHDLSRENSNLKIHKFRL